MVEISIIGLGGIGSVLSNVICRYVNTKQEFKNCTINLIDGDTYEPKNFERQEFEQFGNKSIVKSMELRNKFNNIKVISCPFFINDRNISDVIKEESIVLICVDNHKTRRLISKHCENLNNVTVISGGNELTDGNVQIFIRKGGNNETPSLTEFHQEIENTEDKSPDELSCEELSKAEPQLFFTNFMVAAHMASAFYNITEKKNYKYSEVYFDILTMNSNSKIRVSKNKKEI